MDELTVVIRVNKADAASFGAMWYDLRAAEGLDASTFLPASQDVERFDAGAMTEWVVPLTTAVAPIITGVLGYLVARRGEIEIGGMKFKNILIKQMKEVIEYMDKRKSKK